MGREGGKITKSILKKIQNEMNTLENMLRKIEEFQKQEPNGNLKIQKRGKRIDYYIELKNNETNTWERKYIAKSDRSLIPELARKQYYKILRPLVEHNYKALKKFVEEYRPEIMEQVYVNLSDERKKLIQPIETPKDEIIKRWKEEVYEPNDYFAEKLIFETEQGDLVRSKSEVIIANILYQHRGDLLYKYERPLEVIKDGKRRIIYPDFTILNIHTGKITYWEHAGGMDDEMYVNDFVRKEKTYLQNDIFPGKDVIFTYETQNQPLDIGVVKKIVSTLIEEC